MGPTQIIFTALGVLIFVVVFVYIVVFNGLISAKQKVKEAWSGIDVQLKKRYDLVPNLVQTVKGYAEHESSTLEKVIAARSAAINVPEGQVAEQAGAENMLTGTLKSLFAVSESYPNLKADQNFLGLQQQLSDLETQISSARRIYNANVNELNVKIESFPSNIVAGIHNFSVLEFFEMDELEKKEAEKAPKVEF